MSPINSLQNNIQVNNLTNTFVINDNILLNTKGLTLLNTILILHLSIN